MSPYPRQHSSPWANISLTQLVIWTKKTRTIGKLLQNSRPHLQTGLHSRKLSSGNILKPEDLSCHQPTSVSLSAKSPSRRFTPWTSMQLSTKNSGGWQHDLLRRNTLGSTASTGHMKWAFTQTCGTRS